RASSPLQTFAAYRTDFVASTAAAPTLLVVGRPVGMLTSAAAIDCRCWHYARCAMGLHTYGTMGVDWEERVRFDRLREDRLARISSLLAESQLGALLCFD